MSATAVVVVSSPYIETLQTGLDVKAALEQLQAQIVALATAASKAGNAGNDGKYASFGS